MRASLPLFLFCATCGSEREAGQPADADADSAAHDTIDARDTRVETEPDDGSVADLPDTHVDSDADDTHADDGAVAPGIDYFDPTRVLEVSLTLAPADWAALRNETRTLFDILGPTCLAAPADKVFQWYAADVTVDGVTVEQAGARKKGFLGSLDTVRPALRIEFDELVAGQRLGELERLTLNNGRQDPSRLRQCLAYETFSAAGIAAPRCTFAHVVVNGEDLGLYVHVEAVKKPFLRAHFGEPLGELWEGQLSDFRAGWLATFEEQLEAGVGQAPLDAVVAALAVSDEELLDALAQVIDLEQFMTFWATEVLVGHWDGYTGNTNNFFVYLDGRDQRIRFVPWGTDGTFVDLAERGEGQPTGVLAVGALAHRLYAHAEGRTLYQAELRRVLAEAWDEPALLARIEMWEALTDDAREPGAATAAREDLAQLRAFIGGRRAALVQELASPPDWPAPLREPLCARPHGTVSGTFETTWGTLPIEDLFSTGSGTIDVDSDTLPLLAFGRVGAKAGEGADLPGVAQIVVAAQIIGAGFAVVILQTDLPLGSGTMPLDHRIAAGYLYYVEPPDDLQFLGMLADGDLELMDAGSENGNTIRGAFSATLYGLF